jgi:hypothetical protein
LTADSAALVNSPIGLELATRTAAQAEQLADRLQPARLLNWPRLWRRLAIALAALATVGIWAAWQPALARLAAARLYALSDRPWPRLNFLEVLGFEDGIRKVAKGGNLELRVRADATRRQPPDTCTIHYQTAAGARGSAVMSRDGEVRDGAQFFVFRGKPFQAMQEDLTFAVVGGDFRTDLFQILAVDLPSLIQLDLVYQPPAYTQLSQQRRPWTPGVRVPQGAALTLEGTCSKDLRQLELTSQARDAGPLPPWVLNQDRRTFHIPLGKLVTPVSFELGLLDTDGIAAPQPYAIRVQPITDKPPEVGLRVVGIGNAITADARLPHRGKITDDYDVHEAWFSVQIGDRDLKLPIPLTTHEELEAAVDFREQRAAATDPLVLEPGQELTVTVAASDHYNLDAAPHVGQTDPLRLQVVRADQLLAILEARELSLRRRFEDIVGETLEQRDSLLRLQVAWRQLDQSDPGSDSESDRQPTAASPAGEDATSAVPDATDVKEGPDDVADASTSRAEETSADRNGSDQLARTAEAAGLRELRVQRLIQFNQKVASELAGLAAAFDDILLELDNNRVNSAEREQRLREQIIAPLLVIAEQQLPAFDTTVRELQRQLANKADAARLTDQAVLELERIVAAMQTILDNMLKMESFKEVLDLLRNLLEEQQQLQQRTRDQQRRELLEGILPD